MSTIQKIISRTNDAVYRSSVIYYQKTRKSNDGLSETLTRLMGQWDPYLIAHSHNVSNFATKLAQRLGLRPEQIDLINRSSQFHDIGKIGVPKDILSKPARLLPNEYDIVKSHPGLGAALLQECPDAYALIPIVRHHHEFFNGRGYPDRISGSQIEIEARVVSLADAIDAMLSDRPYRRALSMQQIIAELHRYSDIQFDPILVEPAIQILVEIEPEDQHKSD